jgi:hypothetical protein
MNDSSEPARDQVVVPVRKLIWTIAGATIVVAVVCTVRDFVAFFGGFSSPQFVLSVLKLDAELAIPPWYSGCVMFLCALLALILAWRAKAIGNRDFFWWIVLGLGLFYMSADEMAAIHERLMNVVSQHIQTSGLFTFSWLVVGIPAVALVGLLFVPFLLRQQPRTRWLLILSGGIFLSGAIGCEMLGGLAASTYGTFNTLPYLLASTLEELLEFAGFTLLAVTLLLRLRDDLLGTSVVLR